MAEVVQSITEQMRTTEMMAEMSSTRAAFDDYMAHCRLHIDTSEEAFVNDEEVLKAAIAAKVSNEQEIMSRHIFTICDICVCVCVHKPPPAKASPSHPPL